MLKKFASVLLSLILVICVVPMGAFTITASAATSGDYTYETISNGKVTLSRCNPDISGDITIPSTVNGDIVSRIKYRAFEYCNKLTGVTIPDSVTDIGYNAFYDCRSITNVTIGNSVTNIGNRAFYNCSSLKSLIIPSSVTNMGTWVFSYCTALTDVTIEDGVTSISDYAFMACRSLTNITIPNSVTTIGVWACGDCSSLKSITIPDSVTTIGNWAFDGCDSLDSINVDANNKNYSSQEGVLFNNDKTTLIRYPAGKTNATYSIPGSVTSIGSYSFRCCDSLTSITIQDGVTSIGDYAFLDCSFLTSITIPNSVTSIGKKAFEGCDNLVVSCYENSYAHTYCKDNAITYKLLCSTHAYKTVVTPPTCTTQGYTTYTCSVCGYTCIADKIPATGKHNYIESITTVATCNVAGVKTFACNCGASYTEVIPATGKHIYTFEIIAPTPSAQGYTKHTCIVCGHNYNDTFVDYVLEGTTTPANDFTYTIFNKRVTITGYKGTDSDVIIPSKIEGYPVTAIGQSAFEDCTSLLNLTIPDSVTSIGKYAFYNTGYYNNSANWENDVLYIGKHLIEAKDSLSDSYIIKNGTLIIADNAFEDCDSLKSLTISDSVTHIGDEAFLRCFLLASVTIGNGVTSIGVSAFESCQSLTSITIPGNVTSIGDEAFCACISLASVTIEDGVAGIGYYAFKYCTSLTSITIPYSIIRLDNSAFENCPSLTSINVDADNYYFSSQDGVLFKKDKTVITCYPMGKTNTTYSIPNGVTRIAVDAFYECTSLISITIPDSVTDIGNCAFRYCTSLTNINIPDGITSIGFDAFRFCDSLTSITIPDSVTYIGNWAFDGCDNLVVRCYKNSCAHKYCEENDIAYELIGNTPETFEYETINGEVTITEYIVDTPEVIIPAEINGNPVTAIADKAFYLNRKIKSVIIPSSVKKIGANAFRGCSALTEVNFNEGLETIGTYAFGGTKITKFVAPSTLKTIGTSAFNGVTTLTEVDLGNVQSIKGTAFANTPIGATSAGNRVLMPSTVTEVGAGAFQNCTSLKRIDWYPVKLTSGAAGSMEKPAFQGCTGINEVRIYETAVNIPTYAFYKASDVANNKGITTLRFMAGSKAKTIGDYAFYQQRIGKITFPNTITKIGVESFRNNNMLKVLTFGTGDMTIGQLAFSFCNNLPAVTIPGNVKTIYAYAFRGCARLETVVVEEGVEYISSYAFGFTGLKSITLPASLTKINSGLTYPTNATIYYPADSYVDKYLHSSAARITNEKLVPIA